MCDFKAQREALELLEIRELKDFPEHLVEWEPRDLLVTRACPVCTSKLYLIYCTDFFEFLQHKVVCRILFCR
jgi:hypothetical protein